MLPEQCKHVHFIGAYGQGVNKKSGSKLVQLKFYYAVGQQCSIILFKFQDLAL